MNFRKIQNKKLNIYIEKIKISKLGKYISLFIIYNFFNYIQHSITSIESFLSYKRKTGIKGLSKGILL